MAKIATMATLAVVLLSGGAASATTLRASGGHSTDSGHHGRHHHNDAPTGVFGTVASVNGTSTAGTCGVAATAGTFTLNGFHSTTTFTVDVSTTTTFSEHGVSAPSFTNVCVGEKVGAVGMISSGTVSATSVFVTPPPTPKPQAVFGTVASVNGTSTTGICGVAATAGAFTLNGFHSTTTFTVDVSTTTTFSEHGVSAPSFANVCVGEHVGAVGMNSSGTVTATGVFVTPPPTPKPHAVFGSPRGSVPGGSPDVSRPTGHTSNNHGGFGSGPPTNGPQRFGHTSGHHSH